MCEQYTITRGYYAQNADHLALNSPFSVFFAEVVCTLSATRASRRGFTATRREFCIIRTPARRQPAPNSVKSHRHRCGEHGTIGRACCGARGRRRGLDGLRDDAPSNVSHHSPTGVVGAGGTGGPGCGTRGRRRGLDGIHTERTNSTGVEGAGGPGGPGRASRRGAERSEDAKSRGRPGSPAPGTPVGHAQQPGTPVGHAQQPGTPAGTRETAGARSAAAPRAPHSRASVAYRLSWMLRPGTASISSRV